jgi:hypothetical protein
MATVDSGGANQKIVFASAEFAQGVAYRNAKRRRKALFTDYL